MTKQQLHSKLLGGDPMRAAEARSDRPAELLAGASSSAAEMPPKVIPVPLLDVYDLVGLKEAPGSSKGCKVRMTAVLTFRGLRHTVRPNRP